MILSKIKIIIKKTHSMNEKLNSDWLFRTPIDFEYNKYIALNYIKKSEDRLNSLKIYPDLHEITLNLINIASIGKDNKLIKLGRDLNEYDDEINLKDFKYDIVPEFDNGQLLEINKTIKYTYPKLVDLFNFAKSIWSLAFENIELKVIKNKSAEPNKGYFYYFDKPSSLLYIYSFDASANMIELNSNSIFEEIYCEPFTKTSISTVLDAIKEVGGNCSKLIYRVETKAVFPVRETLLPMAKRKILLKNSSTYNITKHI